MTKQKRSAVPARTGSKVRSRSGNPAVRAGEAVPAVRATKSPSARPRPSKPPAPVLEPGALPPDGASYLQILRGRWYAWWRSVIGVVLGLSLFVLVNLVVSQAVVMVFWATTAGDQPFRDFSTNAFAFQLPIGMLAANLGLAALIPIAWALMALIHQMRPRWLSSVQPGIRWRYLLACLAIATIVLNGFMLLSTTVGEELSIRPQSGFWGFFIVIVLTSPIQAVAEEIFFRGFIFGGFRRRLSFPVAAVLSAAIFGLFHYTGSGSEAVIPQLAFLGLALAWVYEETGSIYPTIALHMLNNAFAFAILTS